MSELTTQLQQARQEIAEKEVESRNWEERAAGSSYAQLLKEERTKLEVSLALAVVCAILLTSTVYVEHWVLYSYSLLVTITVGGVRAAEASCEPTHHSAAASKTGDCREGG